MRIADHGRMRTGADDQERPRGPREREAATAVERGGGCEERSLWL
jgi:hypothetical protein